MAGLIAGSIGKARLIDDSGVDESGQRLVRPPPVAAVAALLGCLTVEQVGFRQIGVQIGVVHLHLPCALHRRAAAERDARAAIFLVANGCDEVAAIRVAPVPRWRPEMDGKVRKIQLQQFRRPQLARLKRGHSLWRHGAQSKLLFRLG